MLALEQRLSFERIHSHCDRGDLAQLFLSRSSLPRNCEAEVRSGITASGERGTQGDELLGLVVQHARPKGRVHEGLE